MKYSATSFLRAFLSIAILMMGFLPPHSTAHAKSAPNINFNSEQVVRPIALAAATKTPRPTSTSTTRTPKGVKQTATPQPTISATATPQPTMTETATIVPTVTVQPTVTETAIVTPVPVLFATAVPINPDSLQLTSTLNLNVRQTGIHRVTYEMLREAGLDLTGFPVASLTILNRGLQIPIYVSDSDQNISFGPGDFIEFYGEALDTLYTDTNVYTMQVSNNSVNHIPVMDAQPDPQLASPEFYTETVVINNQKNYSTSAPGNDPWFDTRMLVYTTPQSWDFSFRVNNLVEGPAALDLVVWGLSSSTHHLIATLNGIPAADLKFDRAIAQTFKINLPAGALVEGENILQITLPGDMGASYDMIALDKYHISYQRAFKPQEAGVTFTAADDLFVVSDLKSPNVIAYVRRNGGLVRLGNVHVQANGTTFAASFAGTNRADTYFLATTESVLAPTLEIARARADLNQPAEYLVIAHPDFITGLTPLIQARQAQGLTVSVIDVNDLYAQYTYGIFDPQAIKSYITYAAQNLGTRYVLLVGGDTYDYRNYMGYNNPSFIPSLYAAVGPGMKFIPADPLYVDINNNYIPDLAIGRFPVYSMADLELIINKTLVYASKSYGHTATFVSDLNDGGVSFKDLSINLASQLPANWITESLHMNDLGISATKSQLLTAMNRGTTLVNFNGHSSSTAWTYQDVFTIADAAALTNTGNPFVAVQWGCWNTYNVDPQHNNLAHVLLLSGDNGAVAVVGGTTLVYLLSEQLLGPMLMSRLTTPGMPIGQAIQDAKAQLAQDDPGLTDIILGWTLMGDPALTIEPLQ